MTRNHTINLVLQFLVSGNTPFSTLDLSIVPPFGWADTIGLERNISLYCPPSHAIIHCLEGHVLLSGLTLVKHSFTCVLLKFYVLGNSSTSCSKLSRWTTFITRFYSWFTHCAQQGKTTGKTSVHLVHHAVKHRGDALIGYMIYLCFTNGVKPSPPWGPPWGPPQVFT